MNSHMIQNLTHPHIGEKIHDTMHHLQDVLHHHTGKHPKETTHEKAPKDEPVGPDEDSCPLDELKKCKERFDGWKSELEHAGHNSDQVEFEDILAAILEVGKHTDKTLELSKTAIEGHRKLCKKMATRLDAPQEPGDDVVCTGEEVRRSFDALFPQIDVLQAALHNISTKLACFPVNNAESPGTTHHWWRDMWSKHHEKFFHALKIVVIIIVKAVLVVVTIHPAGHLVHGLVTAIAPHFEEWAEKEFKKAGEIMRGWFTKHMFHHHSADVKHIVDLIHNELPKQIEDVRRKVGESRDRLKQEAEKVEEQLMLKTSQEHMHMEPDSERAKDAADRMRRMSNGAHVKTLGKVHPEMHHLWNLHFYSKESDEGPLFIVQLTARS
ncbi:uncharacterized protein B0H18DRAFT_48512 [Fomitopsis serialis]|uniref:uncharacterized protein n=1 Tax=Fomitopsis serialis TaxID=139415 RepID=UPI0020075561|nr:uncharacterized protein B0H18DRAFT_48512 [Neoantrodia serialis]KAH9916911.1 hypothetical protein B0H18DRAFT_48512 [Neoantrodia serialis]